MPPLRLRHLPLGRTSYHRTSTLQESITARLLQLKAEHSAAASPQKYTSPEPVLLTFEPSSPIYTLGRRDTSQENALADGISSLRAPIIRTKRGGQTTFHGPGQAVAYPIIDLRALSLSPRCHVDAMEAAVISLLATRYGIPSRRSKVNPGVWTDEDHKIAAVGVHLRRNISSHGVAINVSTDLSFFDDIVACGMATKRATSLEKLDVQGVSVEDAAAGFAKEFAAKLDLELQAISERELLDELQISTSS